MQFRPILPQREQKHVHYNGAASAGMPANSSDDRPVTDLPMVPRIPPSPASEAPSPAQIFLAFAKIGLTSFGGGLSGWMLIEFVQRRRWLTEDAFMTGLALAQAFPGVTVVNLPIWIGYQLRGGKGALLGALGIVVPPMFVVIGLVFLLDEISHYEAVHVALTGMAAAAVGLSLNMGQIALRRILRSLEPSLIALLTFLAIFALQLPLYLVVGAMAPLSIALAYRRIRRGTQP